MHKGALGKWRLMLAKQIFGASDIWRHFNLEEEVNIKSPGRPIP
jgi:hypothetical protein